MNGIKTNARTRVEQVVDLILVSLKLKVLGQPHDEVLIKTDSRNKQYKANEDRKKRVVSNTTKVPSQSS